MQTTKVPVTSVAHSVGARYVLDLEKEVGFFPNQLLISFKHVKTSTYCSCCPNMSDSSAFDILIDLQSSFTQYYYWPGQNASISFSKDFNVLKFDIGLRTAHTSSVFDSYAPVRVSNCCHVECSYDRKALQIEKLHHDEMQVQYMKNLENEETIKILIHQLNACEAKVSKTSDIQQKLHALQEEQNVLNKLVATYEQNQAKYKQEIWVLKGKLTLLAQLLK